MTYNPKKLLKHYLPWLVASLVFGTFLSENAQIAFSDALEDIRVHHNEQQVDNEPEQVSPSASTPVKGNKRIANFSESKELAQRLYAKHKVTFYCECTFRNMHSIDYTSCDYRPNGFDRERASRIEWEHIVTAYDFGHKLPEWRKGHPTCQTKRGKKYRGRKCARHASDMFSYMEADLHNIVPTVGEINAMRSNFPMGDLTAMAPMFGTCETKIYDHIISPRPEDRGFIARAYFYMDNAYPKTQLLDKKSRALFTEWDKKYPPQEFELWRNKQIKALQGNSNPFIDAYDPDTKAASNEKAEATKIEAL